MNFIHKNNKILFSVQNKDFFCQSFFNDSHEDLNEYGLVYLYSPYYDAELDYKEIFIKGDRHTVGWIIPLALLEESDTSLIENLPKYLKKYADIAIKEILVWCVKNIHNIDDDVDDEWKLSGIFKSNIISVFIYRTSKLSKEEVNFYIPALYDAGFYYVPNPVKIFPESYFKSELMCSFASEKRSENIHKITISKFDQSIYDIDNYIELLYKNILPISKDLLQRFIVLYQIMEILMEIQFGYDIIMNNRKYIEKQITKNQLKANLIDATKESTRLNSILSEISPDDNMRDFINEADNLFRFIDKNTEKINTYADRMYQLRNLIVHSLREVIKQRGLLWNLVNLFDKNVYYILSHYKPVDLRYQIFCVEIGKSKKYNIRKFRKFLSQ